MGVRTVEWMLVAGVGAAVGMPPARAAVAGEATRAVVKALEAKDCPAAARELNAVLATSAPEALMLGGSMFEQGLCLKQNVERAGRLYQRASEAGAPGAKARLAALNALPAAGPDKGAALWWGLQAGLPLPQACVVPNELLGDLDRFAKAVNAWPAGQIDACVHVTGVLAALDAEFVLKADDDVREGVAADFVPVSGKVNISFGQVRQEGTSLRPRIDYGTMRLKSYAHDPSPDQLRSMQAEAGQRDLAELVDNVARDALARFPRPATIDPAWRVRLRVEGGRPR
jgi:hypothetical protein